MTRQRADINPAITGSDPFATILDDFVGRTDMPHQLPLLELRSHSRLRAFQMSKCLVSARPDSLRQHHSERQEYVLRADVRRMSCSSSDQTIRRGDGVTASEQGWHGCRRQQVSHSQLEVDFRRRCSKGAYIASDLLAGYSSTSSLGR